MQSQYLTDKDVAAILQIGRTTVWSFVQKGILPAPFKIGRTARWRRADIEAAIESAS